MSSGSTYQRVLLSAGVGIECPLALHSKQSCYQLGFISPNFFAGFQYGQCIHITWVVIVIAVPYKTPLPLPLLLLNLATFIPVAEQEPKCKGSASGKTTPQIQMRRCNYTQNASISRHPRNDKSSGWFLLVVPSDSAYLSRKDGR